MPEIEPEHPDLQHELDGEDATSDPADTEPGEGETDGGELPDEIPDAPEGEAEQPEEVDE